jgi:hypothetical protein
MKTPTIKQILARTENFKKEFKQQEKDIYEIIISLKKHNYTDSAIQTWKDLYKELYHKEWYCSDFFNLHDII